MTSPSDNDKNEEATTSEGTKKTELVKSFWTKTSGKQRGIIFSIAISFTIFTFLAIRDSEDWNYLLDICFIPNDIKPIQACDLKSARASENFLISYTTYTSKYKIFTLDYGSKYPANLQRNPLYIKMPTSYKKMKEEGLIEVTNIAPNNCTQINLYKREDNKRIFVRAISIEGGCNKDQKAAYKLGVNSGWYEKRYLLNP